MGPGVVKLEELIRRARLEPWTESGKIPWHEPEFSARVLREHLTQEHGRASRRFEVVDRHVAWIHEVVLRSKPGRVLDLGCGPGLYTARLAKLGHTCVGIDFSPASIGYARDQARAEQLACEYRLGDLVRGDYGSDFDAALLLSGELNTFSRAEATWILAEAKRALAPSGALVLEVHPEDAVRARAEPNSASFSAERSVFSDEPHVCVIERRFDPQSRTSQERFLVSPVASDDFRVYTSTTRAYSNDELSAILSAAGFVHEERHRSLGGFPVAVREDFVVLVCRAQGAD